METAEPAAASRAQKNRKPSRWLPLAISTIAAGLLIALSYYGLQYFRSSTVTDERGFRVLREMIGQFGNFQEAIAGLLQLVPSQAGVNKFPFLKTIALQGQWDVDVAVSGCKPTSNNKHAELYVDITTPSRDFRMSLCQVRRDATTRKIELTESLSRQLPTFLGQEFFDVVLLTLPDGTILGNIRKQEHDKTSIEFHGADTENLVLTHATALLRSAITHQKKEDQSDSKSKGDDTAKLDYLPHPIVLSDSIAGESYRVFIQPFEPTYRLTTYQAKDAVAQTSLYLIGLKRQDVLQSILDTLGSSGTLVITLIVILVVLSWPLLSLKFASPQEPIAATQVFAATIALLLIPAVIAVAGFSVWTRYRLELWADRSAEVYSRNVEAALLRELSDGAHTLDRLAEQLVSVPIVVEKEFSVNQDENVACVAPTSCEIVLQRPEQPPGALKNWSAWRSAAPLNMSGHSAGLTVNLIGGSPQDRPLDLHDREYFKAIARGEEWQPTLWSHSAWTDQHLYQPQHGLVAQRLFNRSDAARVLQVAVPIHHGGARLGVMTSDTRAYPLTAGVRPPLLRFAIIDSTNGAVLFHSDDTRSLAENLLVETEQNPALREAMHKRSSRYSLGSVSTSDHFDTSYLGEHHRFYYRPVTGVPWGIVVFFPTDRIAEVALQTAVATLATSIGFAGFVILILSLLAFVLPGRPDLDLLASIWPRWESRSRYRIAAAALWILVFAGAAALFFWFSGAGAVSVAVLACVALGFLALARWRKRLRASNAMNTRSYEKYYVASLLGTICLISVLPTLWLAADYHDVSIAAFMRNELRQSAQDIERRYRIIAKDLELFAPDVRLDERLSLARNLRDGLNVPAFQAPEPSRTDVMSWVLADTQPGLWLRRQGPRTLGAIRRQIWTLSTSEQAQRSRRTSADSSGGDQGAGRSNASSDGTDEVVRYWLRGHDGQVIRTVLPLVASKSGPIQSRDDDLLARYRWSDTLILAGAIVASFVLLTLMCWHAARRLFGIRIPFSGRFLPKPSDALDLEGLLDCELALLELKKDQVGEFTWKDEADWRALHCHDLYKAAWATLKPEDRLLMHQVAKGYFANPENAQVIERLLRRGYLKLWPWPRIVEAGFANYIRNLDDAQEFQQLQEQASQNLWHRIRTPLLIVVIVVAGLLMWLAGSAMQILSATLAGIAALFSSITQVTSFASKDTKPRSS